MAREKEDRVQGKFKDTDDLAKARDLSKLQVSFGYAAKQQEKEGGLRFDLIIENPSSTALTILNPLEMLKVTLLDGSGAPMVLPVASPARVKVNYVGKFEPTFPFRVIRVDRSIKGNKEQVDYLAEAIHFPENSITRFVLQIEKAAPSKPNTTASAHLSPVQIGHYTLLLTVSIISHEGEYAYRICTSPAIKIEFEPGSGCLAAIVAFFRKLFGGKR
jgi:hypothetical protein